MDPPRPTEVPGSDWHPGQRRSRIGSRPSRRSGRCRGAHAGAGAEAPSGYRYGPAPLGPPSWEVLGWDRKRDFLSGLDYLVVAIALNRHTVGLVGAEELGMLSADAVLLNPARAQVVDEKALRAALSSGSLRGAALDSHYREPLLPGDPTWDLPNTVVTPHVSGSTGSPRFVSLVWDLFSENVRRYQAGEQLLNVVFPEDLEQ